MKSPKISVIICTYNGEKTISKCIQSIFDQDYKKFEIIFMDGGSTDNTLKIISNYSKKYPNLRLINNPNRLPEGKGKGKWLGFKHSKGEIIAMIDQDNILQRKDLFLQVIDKLKQEDIIGLAGGLVNDKRDSLVVRYVALFGTDSFFAYRSLDFLINIYNDDRDYTKFKMKRENMPLTGGNCFFYRREDLKKIGGYSQDVLVIKKLLVSNSHVGIIDSATKHYAEKSIISLIKKKFKWGKNYFEAKSDLFSYLPENRSEYFYFTKNLLFNLLILPNFYYSLKIYIRKRDPVSFLFPFVAFMNTIAYGLNFLKSKVNSLIHR